MNRFFYTSSCPFCGEVLQDVLDIKASRGALKPNIFLIDVSKLFGPEEMKMTFRHLTDEPDLLDVHTNEVPLLKMNGITILGCFDGKHCSKFLKKIFGD